ncbi:hypothetical protein BaOVIS_012070 [Babesia ovis]|uniref:Uncharacterized protein n=1 Tax=Babesia ovis TaxID=5869 RepID=A0A9W5WUD8_BABOV|nr:hypothetical protein BaOVIS_012070 [Babesia ovis]
MVTVLAINCSSAISMAGDPTSATVDDNSIVLLWRSPSMMIGDVAASQTSLAESIDISPLCETGDASGGKSERDAQSNRGEDDCSMWDESSLGMVLTAESLGDTDWHVT